MQNPLAELPLDADPAPLEQITEKFDLSDGETISDLIETIRTTQTVHDVQRNIGLDRDQTRRLLRELDVLDLVSRRITEGESETTADQIYERLQAVVSNEAKSKRNA